MNRVDRELLEFCRDDFRSLRGLRGRIPGGTLYRHAAKLVRLGWLTKGGALYHSAPAGLRQLTERRDDDVWKGLESVYAPLTLVPSPVHRALVELILAAVVARQHQIRPDRHPFFVCFGRTLRWKTSLGVLVCQALGLDPGRHVIDVGAESGKSLTVRRSGTGALAFERDLLGAPFVTFDEFLNADASVRTSLGLFLAGRLTVPFENEQLVVKPVALLTLNPRDKPTLEGRIGLSSAYIRRAILADLDAVAMPDLATVGQEALRAAQAHLPLTIQPPAVDCSTYRERVVERVRRILCSEAHERVDVELVLNLCTGMTAFLPDATHAIRQVLYDLGLVSETLPWTQSGWIEMIQQFSLQPAGKTARQGGQRALPPAGTTSRTHDDDDAPQMVEPSSVPVVLEPVTVPRRKHGVPDLDLSEELRSRLIWLAVETGQSVEDVLTLLLNFYLDWRQDEDTITTLASILDLVKRLAVAEVDPKALEAFLQARAVLAEHHCGFEDVPEALRVIRLLEPVPDWTWTDAEGALGLVADLLAEKIPVDELTAFLARHRRLAEFGFDEGTAEQVAAALERAGAVGDRRQAVIDELAMLAGTSVDRDRLTREREQLQPEVRRLAQQCDELKAEVEALKQRRDALNAEWLTKRSQLEVLHAFKTLLLRKHGPAEAFMKDLSLLREWLRMGGRQNDSFGGPIVDRLRDKIADFLQQLADEAKS